MKIYTKTGDDGETGLLAGQRVSKDHPRVEAYGTVDELNAILGLARAAGVSQELDAVIQRVQNELFNLGSQLAASEPTLLPIPLITDEKVTALEREIDRFELLLPPLHAFILPAGALAAATLHVARTVCRRAERRVVTLAAPARRARVGDRDPLPEPPGRFPLRRRPCGQRPRRHRRRRLGTGSLTNRPGLAPGVSRTIGGSHSPNQCRASGSRRLCATRPTSTVRDGGPRRVPRPSADP